MKLHVVLAALLAMCFGASDVAAQVLGKSAINVQAGNTATVGATFGYRLTYNCSSTTGPCLGAEVVDLLPPEVQFVSTVPASPTGDVAAIQVTPNFGGTGRTRVRFQLINPLPAGNSGDLIVNVRFPNGSTPDGTVASNTADGINLSTTPGTFTTPPVNVTAVASVQVVLAKTLTSSPANLDLPESYRLRISVPNVNGALNLTSIGPVVDTLPPGTVFNGATPAADCQPGCVGTTPATVTWTSPCSVPLGPNQNCDITVNVTFPSATFPSGVNVTNSFTAEATPLGEPPQTFGPSGTTHPVTTFVPAPGAGLTKNMANNTPNPPTLNQTFSYDLVPSNNGNVPLDNLVLIDTLPVEMQINSVTTGAYTGLADFAAGEGVRVSYEKNTALGVFTLWGSSPNTTTSTTLTAPPPGLGAGEYITRIRWEYGQAQPGMAPSTRPLITGRIINPDNAGGPVAIGDTIANCVDLTSVYTAGPTAVNRNACRNFVLSGPFAQLNPAKDNLSGGGPFNPGQTVSWRLRVRSDARSSDPLPLEYIVASDLLPTNLSFASWTFDDQGTGLPAPQVFQQIPNFQGTGRTLLVWRWNPGSGNLGVNQQVWINISTSIRNGAPSGSLSNDFTLEHDAPGLAQRCTTGTVADTLDFDADGNMAELLCRATGTITVAGIAQLISSKQVQGTCDGGAGIDGTTLEGGSLLYRLRVQNVGTVTMQNFVLIDILPIPGDTGVRDTNPRGSQWQADLVAPILAPPGTTVYYSTSANPCRGEVGGPTTSCDAPNWTTAAPVPFSQVRSFKIEFGSRSIAPFDFVEFGFPLVTPSTLTPGTTAYNSFAYQADRADGLGSLAAEPQRVGVTLGSCESQTLGDYVWEDSNADGLQNDGDTGINGINVDLYEAGADGIVGTPDDLLVARTITQDHPTSGGRGWYRFPGIPAANYRVCVQPPANFLMTARDQGGDDLLDSDGDLIDRCSESINLSPGEDDPGIDFGLVRAAALGDYVWFDLNSDGEQNDPLNYGANGVTVRLRADDGDGVPEAADAIVATTLTATDAFARPGYYVFNDLVPGQPYFVEFVAPQSSTGFTTQDAAGDTADSDADTGTGRTQVVTLASGEFNPTLDAGLVNATGTLALGDQVWLDGDNDGVFEPENGETGIDGVRLSLYRDASGDGEIQADEYLRQTDTFTQAGFAGRYGFDNLAPASYIVVVEASNFVGGPLAGLASSSGNDPAPDPDDDVNGDDNGRNAGAIVASLPVTLTDNGEPTADDGNNDTNLTIDFGFVDVIAPLFDYGDAPDAGTGTAAADYNTLAFDNGPVHALIAGAPHLGDCVDADNGSAQDALASTDDITASTAFGACAVSGDDEDGVSFTGTLSAGSAASIDVRVGAPAACALDAWVDWNRDGDFGDAGEQIATALNIAAGATTTLTPTVPAAASAGPTYARFRCSSAGGSTPVGLAADGEVEDYLVIVGGADFGDAPASYTTQGAGAALHNVIDNGALRLGQCVDLEADGQPTALADGDDINAGTTRFGLCFDDEDGTTFAPFLAACQASAVTVLAGAAGVLDGWIDFSGDGDFDDANERIFSAQPVTAGSNALSFGVPCATVQGTTYSRLRLSSAGIATPAGSAPDGEVEDDVVTVRAVDFGDAPDSYATTFATGGPNHGVVTGYSLGATIDSEGDGQPNAGATGDGADEDGVTLPASFAACGTTSVNIALTNTAGVATANLDAWIDFDADGSFDEPRDRIATSLAINVGLNALPVNVPCDAPTSSTYARFRLSADGVANATGSSLDGEVEDYAVTIDSFDFGDLPDTAAGIGAGDYRTLSRGAGDNGARHRIVPGLFLGAGVDNELDGQPNAAATGDDLAGATPDDEDGIDIATLNFTTGSVASVDATVTNTTGNAGRLCGFADLNADGDFDDANESASIDVGAANATVVTLAFGTLDANPGTYNLVPPGATRHFRFRLADSQAACAADNDASLLNGEVEDYAGMLTVPVDRGDLPAPYPTLAPGGAGHPLRSGLRIGACIDADSDGQPSVDADGDDLAAGLTDGTCTVAGDDEDGLVASQSLFRIGAPSLRNIPVTNTTATAAMLCAYVDWNADGDFIDVIDGVPEATSTTVASGTTGPVAIDFGVVPLNAVQGASYLRLRLSSEADCSVGGLLPDGEVEDHLIRIEARDFGDLPDTAPGVSAANYQTLEADGGASHGIVPNVFLGASVDGEADGAPTANADGDDLAALPDDEDGVVFPGVDAIFANRLVAGVSNPVDITASANGFLNCWFDFDGNGTLTDAGEQAFAETAVVAGAQTLAVNVPQAAVSPVYWRCRYSDVALEGSTPVGAATRGEVEDGRADVIALDLGDLPDAAAGNASGDYATRRADDGARHAIVANLRLGACVDAEGDGQPGALANGDDLGAGTATGVCATPGDDEDGVTVASLQFVGGTVGTVSLTATNATGAAARLCGFVDYDGDGQFVTAGEQAQIAVPDGSNDAAFTLTFGSVPFNGAPTGFARFRIDDGVAGCSATGAAISGEVEDYPIALRNYDYGDLPDAAAGEAAGDYRTRLADSGARHLITTGLFLGAGVDPEADGQPNADALGDDASADDEDGITFPPEFDLGSPARVQAVATNLLGAEARVCGYIDWNADGDFADAQEAASVNVPAGTNAQSLTLNFGPVPVNAVADPYARFRLGTDACSANGDARNGEVEDYRLSTSGVGAISLGDLVFEDRNNNCAADVGEPGIANVPVRLFLDADANGVADGPAVASTTTDATGRYGFADLLPGNYFVELDRPSIYLSSSGGGLPYSPTGSCEPAPDADNDVDNDDNGSSTGTLVRSSPITLTPELKPGPPDVNSNPRVDFGLLTHFDLSLAKDLAADQLQQVMAGSAIRFVITVTNQGTVPATAIVVTDRLPPGTVLMDATWTASPDGTTATQTIAGPLAPGASIALPIQLRLLEVDGEIRNMAQITSALDGNGNPPSDIDSVPDNSDDDEDDQDTASLVSSSEPVVIPATGAPMLALLAALMLALGAFAARCGVHFAKR